MSKKKDNELTTEQKKRSKTRSRNHINKATSNRVESSDLYSNETVQFLLDFFDKEIHNQIHKFTTEQLQFVGDTFSKKVKHFMNRFNCNSELMAYYFRRNQGQMIVSLLAFTDLLVGREYVFKFKHSTVLKDDKKLPKELEEWRARAIEALNYIDLRRSAKLKVDDFIKLYLLAIKDYKIHQVMNLEKDDLDTIKKQLGFDKSELEKFLSTLCAMDELHSINIVNVFNKLKLWQDIKEVSGIEANFMIGVSFAQVLLRSGHGILRINDETSWVNLMNILESTKLSKSDQDSIYFDFIEVPQDNFVIKMFDLLNSMISLLEVQKLYKKGKVNKSNVAFSESFVSTCAEDVKNILNTGHDYI